MNPEKIWGMFEDEKKVVRAVCHNYLQQPMYGEKLQDTVIFHLEMYTRKIATALETKLRIKS